MKKLTRYDDIAFLRTFPFRSHDRVYGGSRLPGHLSVVAANRPDKDGRFGMIEAETSTTHISWTDDDNIFFCFLPLLDMSLAAALDELRNGMATFIRASSPAVAVAVASMIETPPEEPRIMSTKEQQKRLATAFVGVDHERHTCIAFQADDEMKFIPLEGSGLELESTPVHKFEQQYKVLKHYPVERAAALYAGYAAHVGGTPEAVAALATLITLTPKEIQMATAKKKSNPVEKKAKAAAAPKTKVAKKNPGEPRAPRNSAASMFRDLIMSGVHTDDAIFAKVQKEFGLDDKKRSYVAWYRHSLVKQGIPNVPGPLAPLAPKE